MPFDDRVLDLVERAQELQAQGLPVVLGELCRDCPDLLGPCQEALRVANGMDVLLNTPRREGPEGLAPPAAPARGLPEVPGYEIVGELGRGGMGVVLQGRDPELGRGGMGVVLQGRDPELGRDLAVEVLRPEHQDDPAMLRRFREEAQVCGQLQHPGIVPVYALGRSPDGRPYFAMKLVRGQTLAALLAGRTGPSQDLPRFLGIFEQVCQTLAYAHSKGALHRDLKPGNVMVGPFGEVQVMDWGLAKVLKPDGAGAQLPSAEGPTSCRVQTVPTGPAGPSSQAGAVLGTYAHMAPEQALGQVEALDERCDVFGLGAILCEVLTGAPPYAAEAGWQAHLLAARADLADAFARLEGCGADAELVGLARACLAPQREGRPAAAGAVAAAVAAHRSGVQERLRAAELERARAEVRAAGERRRRRLALALAAALLLVVGGGSAGWLLQQQQAAARARQGEVGQRALLALQRGRDLLEQGWAANDLAKLQEAQAEAERAAEVAGSGAPEEVRQQAAAFRQEVAGRLARVERNGALLVALLDVSAPREAKAYASDESGRMVAQVQPSVEEQYAAAFRTWGLDLGATPQVEVLARLRAEPRPVVEEVVAALDAWALLRRRQREPEARWRRLLRVAEQLDRGERRRWRVLAGEGVPGAGAVAGLAGGLAGGGQPWAALAGLEGCQCPRRLELRRQGQDSVPVLTALLLAQASAGAGDPAAAEGVLRRALAARPDQVVLLGALGGLLEDQGRWPEAVECHRAARALRPRLGIALSAALLKAGHAVEGEAVMRDLVRRQPNHPEMHFYLGNALAEQKKLVEAVAAYRRAIQLRPDDAKAHYTLGNALYGRGRLADAEAAYRKVIELQPSDAKAHTNLGAALCGQGKLAEAVAALRQAIELKPDDALAHNNLGNALRPQGKLVEAVAAYRKAIALQPGYAKAHYNLSNALAEQGKLAEAVAAYRQAIVLHQPGYVDAHNNLGNTLSKQGKLAEAVAAFRQAIALQPDLALAHTNLGVTLSKQGKLAEAVAAFRKAIQLKPNLAEAHCNLGMALLQQGQFKEALAALKQGYDLLPAKGPGREQVRQLVQYCQRQVVLEARLPDVLPPGTQKPANLAEQVELARLCGRKQLYAAAAHFYAGAFAERPTLADDLRAGHRYNAACAAALAAGQGEDAAGLKDEKRSGLRRQALTWLRADLRAWARLVQGGTPQARAAAGRALADWRQDADLTGLRDEAALAKLPAAERDACRQLWAEVAALRERARKGG
jgi:serine/threonine-protein kinase